MEIFTMYRGWYMSLMAYFENTTMGAFMSEEPLEGEEMDVGKDNIFNLLFNDRDEFINFFKNNKDAAAREGVLKTDKLRYWYCRFINDDEVIWSKITVPNFCYEYCFWVTPRVELYSKIYSDRLILKYLQNIGNSKLLIGRIKHDGNRYNACVAGYDSKRLWGSITSERWARAYVTNVKPRVELKEYTGYTDVEWNNVVKKHVRRLNENCKNDGRNGSRRSWKEVRDMDTRVQY